MVDDTVALGLPMPPLHTNFGVPHAGDVADILGEQVDRSAYAIQAKRVSPIDLRMIDELAKIDATLASDWSGASAWLQVALKYRDVKVSNRDRRRARTRMNRTRFEQYMSADLVEESSSAAKGFTRIFLVPEDWKAPPRFRVISHTMTANSLKVEEHFKLPTLSEILEAACGASHAVALDMTAFFHQFPLAEEVRDYFSFFRGSKTFRHTRLPMGFRQACSIAQSAMRALAARAARLYNVRVIVYIDNVLFLGAPEAVAGAAAAFMADCASASATVGVPQAPEPSTTIEFCGMVLDLTGKLVRVAEKTIVKLMKLADAPFTTHRRLAATLSTALFCSRVLAISRAQHFEVFELWRSFRPPPDTEDIEAIDKFWDSKPSVNEVQATAVQTWLARVLSTRWAPIRTPFASANPDLVVVTDASKDCWAGICLKPEAAPIHCAIGARCTKSSNAAATEPWAIYNTLSALTQRDQRANVTVLTDNIGMVFALNKGFARSWHANRVVELLERYRPGLRLHAIHIPGTVNPSDSLSRGQNLESSAWDPLLVAADSFPLAVKRVVAEAASRAPHIPFRLGVTSV